MGYKITYGRNHITNCDPSHHRIGGNSKRYTIFLVTVIIVAVLVGCVINNEFSQVADTTTRKLVEDIMSGENFVDAITVFCKDVIDNAKRIY